jgi:putative membrane protein
MWYGMMGFLGGWMILIWVVIVGLIVWGVVTLVRHSGSRPDRGSNRTPLDIAKERYAKGEITKEEFERIKKDLM